MAHLAGSPWIEEGMQVIFGLVEISILYLMMGDVVTFYKDVEGF